MNEEISQQEKVTLLKRLTTKLHTAKIAQKVTGLVLGIATALTIVSCQPNNSNNTNNNNDNDITIGDNTNNEFSEYSDLLQNVLNNTEYDNLIKQARNGNTDLYQTGAFEPHPYAFLEKEGLDVEEIKNGNDIAYTMSYILDEEPNSLYMHTRVLENNSYYTNYLLKYTLTDEEMDDYHLLHAGGTNGANFYVQSIFMNNEISKTKTPTIVGKSKMSIEAFEGMTESMGEVEMIDSQACYIIFTNPNKEANSFELKLIPKFYDNYHSVFSGSMINLDCLGNLHFSNDIYTSPYTYGIFLDINSSSEKSTFYFTQNALLNLVYCKDFEIDHPNK